MQDGLLTSAPTTASQSGVLQVGGAAIIDDIPPHHEKSPAPPSSSHPPQSCAEAGSSSANPSGNNRGSPPNQTLSHCVGEGENHDGNPEHSFQPPVAPKRTISGQIKAWTGQSSPDTAPTQSHIGPSAGPVGNNVTEVRLSILMVAFRF